MCWNVISTCCLIHHRHHHLQSLTSVSATVSHDFLIRSMIGGSNSEQYVTCYHYLATRQPTSLDLFFLDYHFLSQTKQPTSLDILFLKNHNHFLSQPPPYILKPLHQPHSSHTIIWSQCSTDCTSRLFQQATVRRWYPRQTLSTILEPQHQPLG